MIPTNYTFLDCGYGKRLEKIGDLILERPAPQAEWEPRLSAEKWQEARARYVRQGNQGHWVFTTEDSETLSRDFYFKYGPVSMELRFSENGQIGIYPEQLPNWVWLKETIRDCGRELRILNGFAYTGGSTLFSSLGGSEGKEADVCHVDASKSAVNWARQNRDISNLQDQTVRFVVEDILRFMEREIKRGRSYQGIILDPPAFGRAPGGRTWVLKKNLPELMDLSIRLLGNDPEFFLLSCHDPEITMEVLAAHIASLPGVSPGEVETLNLELPSTEGNSLPNGIAARWRRGK